MTVKFYCNLCNNPCQPNPTRRWEHVRADLGLEVVVLRGSKPVGDIHLCDDCILTMFWVMLERVPNSRLLQRQRAMNVFESVSRAKEEEFRLKEDRLIALSNEVQKQNEDLKILNARYDSHIETRKEVDSLIQQLETIKARERDLIKKSYNEGKQAAVDEKCYSDYVKKVSYNQYRRSGY